MVEMLLKNSLNNPGQVACTAPRNGRKNTGAEPTDDIYT
jgi:hypothetical protein